ncbi:tripartite tricarboxylate transporter TctB family protein [Oceanicella sp. SM1341]|uniref:tripartite tricarboxylate transporter TctB family protein n=1 Tax=Oceanicella sp. SM1341 TaxID=1548889 RepID=UPI000E525430|nr:tripartite tricarboxylate transporter TctB family protein [Oceanicella sp. SM1341]
MSPKALRADRITAAVLFALGLAMLAGGFTMDRLEVRQIHPASIPGLVPMILGAMLALCAVLLFLGARGPATETDAETALDVSGPNLWITLALTLFYALGLVGRMPFELATALFIAGFVAVFTWPAEPGLRGRAIVLGRSAVYGVALAFAVSVLFRDGFLVRLP